MTSTAYGPASASLGITWVGLKLTCGGRSASNAVFGATVRIRWSPGAEQTQMSTYASQPHESTESYQHDTAEKQPAQSKPGIRGLVSSIR